MAGHIHCVINESASTFGQRLRQARQSKKMTQDQLAKAVGYKARQGICNHEKDLHDPSRATIEALAKVLDVNPCWLAFGDRDA